MNQVDKMKFSIRELLEGELDRVVRVTGWIKTHRSSKKVAFIELFDGSCHDSLQLVVLTDAPSYQAHQGELLTGTSLVVEGTLVASQGKGQSREVQVTELKVLGAADSSYPLQKKEHSLEFLREQPHLRARSQTFSAVARVRSEASFAVHQFFREQGFFYLHAPIITTSDCEGAGALFGVSVQGGESGKPPGEAAKFFGRQAYLTVSGQLQAECYATAIRKVYTFGPTFRAENSNTTRH